MKVLDFHAPLKNIRGEPFENQTLGTFLYDALQVVEQDQPADEKLMLARVVKKIIDSSELTIEELAAVKKRALKYASTSVILCVEQLLEGK